MWGHIETWRGCWTLSPEWKWWPKNWFSCERSAIVVVVLGGAKCDVWLVAEYTYSTPWSCVWQSDNVKISPPIYVSPRSGERMSTNRIHIQSIPKAVTLEQCSSISRPPNIVQMTIQPWMSKHSIIPSSTSLTITHQWNVFTFVHHNLALIPNGGLAVWKCFNLPYSPRLQWLEQICAWINASVASSQPQAN